MQAQPDTIGGDVAAGIIIVALIFWCARKWFLEGYTGTLPPKSRFAQWVDAQVANVKLGVGISLAVVVQLVIWAIAAVVVLAVIIWAFRTVFG